MARVSLVDVTKRYGDDQEAVSGVSLEIADGELVVMVGPSGSGKSTALRMIAGLEGITSGEIWIGDRLVNGCRHATATSRWSSRTTPCTRR